MSAKQAGGEPPPVDLTDPWRAHTAAIRTVDAEHEAMTNGTKPHRVLHFDSFDDIEMEATIWLWEDRIPLGEFTLLGGREGIGKSICSTDLAASLTVGTLPGCYFGQPQNVAICATEDSLSKTIKPRLVAAGADLKRVFRIRITTENDTEGELSLPSDLDGLEDMIGTHQPAALFLDPLMSRLSAKLDTHKDQEVRQALEPFVSLIHKTNMTGVGLIHVNKGGGLDVLNSIMGSKAFTAVARSVLLAITDPSDPTGQQRLLALAKNNLGTTDVWTLPYRIEGRYLGDDRNGLPIWAGKAKWGTAVNRPASEIAAEAAGGGEALREAAEWLDDYLTGKGGSDTRGDILRNGNREGHSTATIRRAAQQLRIDIRRSGMPAKSTWYLPTKSD